jgi:transposase InsO family protein
VEIENMSHTVSASGNSTYGVARVLAIWGLPRSSFYAARSRQMDPRGPRKRGPKVLSDAELLLAIRSVLDEAMFTGEGYRKVWARLRHQDIRTSKERVNRLMRENQLLSPHRQALPEKHHPHDGVIVTERPDQMWGTDATATCTIAEGAVTIFAAIDHCTAECVGIHAVKKANRFEALEPVRQAVRERFGVFSPQSAAGLELRHDHGSVYMSDDFQNEIRFLGIESSPAFVRQPEGNGCIERFFRTLKEQLLWVRNFRNLDELQTAVAEFRHRYNHNWIIGRLGYRTPAQTRRDFELVNQIAA